MQVWKTMADVAATRVAVEAEKIPCRASVFTPNYVKRLNDGISFRIQEQSSNEAASQESARKARFA